MQIKNGFYYGFEKGACQRYFNNNWLKQHRIPMRRKLTKRETLPLINNFVFSKIMNANVFVMPLMGKGMEL